MKDSAHNKRSVFDSPILSGKIRSANVKIFPEGGEFNAERKSSGKPPITSD